MRINGPLNLLDQDLEHLERNRIFQEKQKKTFVELLKRTKKSKKTTIVALTKFNPEIGRSLKIMLFVQRINLLTLNHTKGIELLRQQRILMAFILKLLHNPKLLKIPPHIRSFLNRRQLMFLQKVIAIKILMLGQATKETLVSAERQRVLNDLSVTSFNMAMAPELISVINQRLNDQANIINGVRKSWAQAEMERKLERYTFEIGQVKFNAKNLYNNE